ncbi:Spy/CpxP family protein refolding chaperone [Allosphingosinicella vermicomposti]|uniref:Spy/CpxP family protein refolding chaperone n=1 Tax=Allosphingosinicella vermicomposti TaxID=614671 RepID=UPI002477F535|nr:periplasmic heavy metal sensor [Allosphingosinicella vermicomposti]
MTLPSRKTFTLAVVAFLAAMTGVLVGRGLSQEQPERAAALHEVLHEELGLNDRQLAKIDALEAEFATRRAVLEAELRADNARLAAAIKAEKGYGPRVQHEIERSHSVMGSLQKETLAHIFAMRAVLTPKQAERFDKAVVEALTADAE